MKHFPIGFDDFAKLVHKEGSGEYSYYFVDKSLLIKDLLNPTDDIILLTRPRRFGKTMNMSMLQHFFDIEHAAENRTLFVGLKVEDATVTLDETTHLRCMNYQGQYPTIFITLKDCAFNTFGECYENIKGLIYEVYVTHNYLLTSDRLIDSEKAVFQRILNKSALDDEYNTALKSLCKYLSAHYSRKVMVLIDEYDTPFQMALHKGYYDELQPMMRTLIGGVLKGNVYLEKAVLTGILRIAGAGIFSGANNVSAYTVLDERFSEHFGFTEDEVQKMLVDMEQYGLVNAQSKLEQVREWYNGYQFGKAIIYNPWSTMVCFSRNFHCDTYWVNTSDDKLLRDLLPQSSSAVQRCIRDLIAGEPAEVVVRKELRFDEELTPEKHVWSLLLSAGYLKVVASKSSDLDVRCAVQIPNMEVGAVYRGVFKEWLEGIMNVTERDTLIEYLLTGDAKKFGEGLKAFYMRTVSHFDVGSDKIEAFYHGFMVGLVGLCQMDHKTYLHSNKPSGLGRYDLVIEPKNVKHPKYNVGIILEFKRTLKKKELKSAAAEAIEQVKRLHYDTELRSRNVQNIVIIGIAFCGKVLEHSCESLPKPKIGVALAQVGLMRMRPAITADDDKQRKGEAAPKAKRSKLA